MLQRNIQLLRRTGEIELLLHRAAVAEDSSFIVFAERAQQRRQRLPDFAHGHVRQVGIQNNGHRERKRIAGKQIDALRRPVFENRKIFPEQAID